MISAHILLLCMRTMPECKQDLYAQFFTEHVHCLQCPGKTLSLLVSSLAWQEKRKKAAIEKYNEESDAWRKRQVRASVHAWLARQSSNCWFWGWLMQKCLEPGLGQAEGRCVACRREVNI